MNECLPYKLSKRAAKELKKIRKSDRSLFLKMDAAIQAIRANPYAGEPKKGDLKGYFCVDINHMGSNYELCYGIEEDENGEMVLIILMGPRENFYEQLKRYLYP